MLIARDSEFNNIVNVVPLEGGFILIKKPRDFGGLVLCSHQREYVLKFRSSDELVKWYHLLQSVVSKEAQVDSYTTRKKEQDEKVSNLNKYSQYKKIVSDIEEKLLEIKKLCSLKKKFEKENQTDEDIAEFIETMKENSNL